MEYLKKITKRLKVRTDLPSQLWDYSEENMLEGDWILASPFHVWGKRYREIPMPVYGEDLDFGLKEDPTGPEIFSSVDQPGRAPRKLLAGHSYRLYEEVYRIITGARALVDIATLHDCDGEFLAAIQNALSWLSFLKEEEKPVVRFLYSNYPTSERVTTEKMRNRLVAKIPNGNTLKVYVGNLHPLCSSWNHTKIVSADGKSMMTGGHNFSSKAYLREFPVFDLSMLTEGQAAYAAQTYLDYLWKYCGDVTCSHDREKKNMAENVCYAGEFAGKYLKKENSIAGRGKKVPMLAAGRRAAVNRSWKALYREQYTEPSDEIFLELFGMAEKRICISQQTISTLTGALPEVIKAWAKAILRGVEIQIVVSFGENPSKAMSGYSGMNPRKVERKIREELIKMTKEKDVDELIKKQVHAANLHYNSEESGYPGAKRQGIPNHAKFVMVDDSVFYIGSQNQYRCNLNEFGIFAESREKCRELISAYWGPLWKFSCPDAFSIEDADEEAVNEMEAALFWLELKINKMLREVFTEAVEELFCVPEPYRDYEGLNGMINRAGYNTEYRYVRAVMDRPLFQEVFAEEKERIQAFRFVRLLLREEGMMQGFLGCLKNGLLREMDAKQLLAQLQDWVEKQGFSCRIGAVIGSFQDLVDANLSLWAGNYRMVLTKKSEMNRNDRQRRVLAEEMPDIEEVVLTVGEDGSCSLDGEQLCSVQFDKGTLRWEAGEISFGRRLRSFGPWDAGTVQCEGWIDRKEADKTVRRGVSGIRMEDTESVEKPDTASGIGVVGAGAGILLSLSAIAAIGIYCKKDTVLKREEAGRIRTKDGKVYHEFFQSKGSMEFSDLSGELELKELDRETSQLQDFVRRGEYEKNREEYEKDPSEHKKDVQQELWEEWERRHDREERTEKNPQTERPFEDSGEKIWSKDRKKRLDEEVTRRRETSESKPGKPESAKEREKRRRQEEERRGEEERREEEQRRREEQKHRKKG